MDEKIALPAGHAGQLAVDYAPCINYAMMLNNHTAFSMFDLSNNSPKDWHNVQIAVSGNMFETCVVDVPYVKAGDTVSCDNVMLLPVARKLILLSEAVKTTFTIRIVIDGESVLTKVLPITLMAFDQWPGYNIIPELVASFVTPNHPCIAPICLEASRYLGKLSGDCAMNNYVDCDDDRVRQQIESVYAALLEQDIVYCTAPASFELLGQRVRLADNVLEHSMGNCLDLSLLLCSCLEHVGLRTVIVLFETHAIVGVWLNCMQSCEVVGYDSSDIIDACNDGEMLLIEPTSLTANATFEEACGKGESQMIDGQKDFKLYVDIKQARYNGVRPLPHFIRTAAGWEVDKSIDYDKLFDELCKKTPYDIRGVLSDEKLKNKQLLWERKLLDLSLRNNLLNMKNGKLIVPVKGLSIDTTLDHLKAETLVTDIDAEQDPDTVKGLYRAARLSIEETGANTLFLVLGSMRWYEAESNRAFRAPIIFIPLEIVRHGAKKYLIRPRDEEAIINITLIEMMRQSFDLEVPYISPMSDDDSEIVDWQRVFDILRTSMREVNDRRPLDKQWEIVEECHIGIFSFNKFVMWNDIHYNPKVLAAQPLLRSLIEGSLMLDGADADADARELDQRSRPADYAIPLDVDSSQLEAVVNAGQGRSFILYGPPGTGKSQTITNIIANALYHGKRVLFVSEKKAALEVVQQRLANIGLDPYCLELHSNKTDKKSFIAQMEKALNQQALRPAHDLEAKSNELFATRCELNNYIESLHCVRDNKLSLYDCINRYLEIEGEPMKLSYNSIKSLTPDDVDDICAKCATLDIVESIVKMHPAQHPLLGLYPLENTADNQRAVTEMLFKMPEVFARVRKKADGIINRWFSKRSLIQILERQAEWSQFCEVAAIDNRLFEDFDNLEQCIALWSENTDSLRQWYHYALRAYELDKYGVSAILEYYLKGHTGTETAWAFKKGYYKKVASDIIDSDPSLRGFNGILFEEVVARYRKLADVYKQVTRTELVSRLSNWIASLDESDRTIKKELTYLRKKIASNGRATSVRRILNETRHVLPCLCPCMLMSPLSVAQYLEMSPNQFDLVVFDEASQMPTSEAIGAIARARAVVVVGDPKQMPPTSFFVSQTTGEADADIDDLESILDDCISLGMPGRYLNWHYRSRHESLIAFSNRHIYDGKLITFPSIDDQQRKVTMQHVDGYYDFGKSRSNRAEAKAIVEDVISRLSDMLDTDEYSAVQPVRSIGIVAFSKVQSSLIEDLLNDALARRPELEKFAMSGTEPIFVKNLENVQGDERDIILFSVGYGPDKKGNVSMNFGPLNQVGGERRLNVAVSRARYEMKVFSTLRPHQIDLQRTGALGVKMLKQFLEYAENGTLPTPSSQSECVPVAPIIRRMADELSAQGHEVHLNVGKSRFRIDLAIVDKEESTRYATAIITDGKSYYDIPTARDREIVQPSILASLGWKLSHAWTADHA
jgi:DNA polymerase III delta prime subunit